jgi:hypothetical protein
MFVFSFANTKKLKIKKLIPTEGEEQENFFSWARLAGYPYNLLFAIPNGSHKSPAMAAKFKREGLMPGIPDTMLPHASKGFNGCFIEMKRIKGSVTTEEQIKWKQTLEKENYFVAICKGFDEAKSTLENYVKGK